MATLAEIEAALRGADAAGDADAARVLAAEYARLRSAEPVQRPGAIERGVRGFVRGLQDAPDALKQVQSRMLAAMGVPGAADAVQYWDRDIAQRNDAYRRDVRGGQNDIDFGRELGNMAFTAPISASMPASLGQAVVQGAVTGGALGALQPVTQGDFGTEKIKQALVGAATGGVTAPVAYGVSKAIQPTVAPNVRKLINEGITPTPGQIMGGPVRRAEEKLASVPILGSAIRAGEDRATAQLNAAAINRALDPIGKSLPKGVAGRAAIEYADDELGKAYTSALNAIGPVKLDAGLTAALRQVYGSVGTLPKDKGDQFARIVQAEIGNRAQAGVLSPEALKAAESNLGQLARGYLRSADFDQRQLGDAIEAAQSALRDMVQRQAPREAADALKAANLGWANFKRVQRAATYVGGEQGEFTAAQLQSAVKALDPSKDKGRFAKGQALMQDLSEPAKQVMTQRVPNSGTADRALSAMLGGSALTGGAMLHPALALGAIPSLAYTPAGQAAVASLLTGRQGPVAGLLSESTRRAAVPLGAALTPAMYGLLAQ